MPRRAGETTTEAEQRRNDTAHALFHAWRTLDQCDGGDIAGHNDLTRRIARLTEQYREQVFIEYCIKAEAIESERIELAHEKA